MNILVPDSWLREYLITKATPKQIKDYLSLCGPSMERINNVNGEIIYDVEITTNRPDSMSIFGIAREAAAILPRFKILAKLINDPYKISVKTFKHKLVQLDKLDKSRQKQVKIITDTELNPRWTSIIIDNVKVGPSPKWLREKLELTGIRSLNNVIDVTNYLMRVFGQPAHAFDFNQIKPDKSGIPLMKLRASEKGEKITTLDGKTHTLPGGSIIIEDGSGRLIDLCGIMGAENSSIKSSTKTVLLFMQTYDPVRIRRTMMALSHRTEAGSLFEKGLDPELVLPTVIKGTELIEELTGGHIASQLYDIYPTPYKPYNVSVKKSKLNQYLGTELMENKIYQILESLGLICHSGKQTESKTRASRIKNGIYTYQNDEITITVPSFRQDIKISEDIIEEIARVYGYHNIPTNLPDTEPPLNKIDNELIWENDIKIRLRDWGYSETYTYSMISEDLMDVFRLDKKHTYKISNPLSSEWVYMRPNLLPNALINLKQNLKIKKDLCTFELSMVYLWRENNLPQEIPTLVVLWSGEKFRQAKGLAEELFSIFGINFPNHMMTLDDSIWQKDQTYKIGEFGLVGKLNPQLLTNLGISVPVTALEMDFLKLVKNSNPSKIYQPVPKYPPIIEDITLSIPYGIYTSDVISELCKIDKLINKIEFIDRFGTNRSFRITYLNTDRNLTADEVKPIREKLIGIAKSKFKAEVNI